MKYFSIIYLAIFALAGCKKKESKSIPAKQKMLISHKWYYKEVISRWPTLSIDTAKTACMKNCYITFSDTGNTDPMGGIGIAHYEHSVCTPYAPFRFKYYLTSTIDPDIIDQIGICKLDKPYNLDSFVAYESYSLNIYGDSVLYLQNLLTLIDYKFVTQ